MKKIDSPLSEQDTYVFIDVSNIRLACLKTLGMKLDFAKLLKYFRGKYPNLKDARYYEGCAKNDLVKRRIFNFLRREGYTICPLTRMSYYFTETDEQAMKCPNCQHEWVAELAKNRKAMKSNVDVYLATELLKIAYLAEKPIHIILVSCDGDYAEMIKSALENENVTISVLATPMVRDLNKNTLSKRLKLLYSELGEKRKRYHLKNIANIEHMINAPIS